MAQKMHCAIGLVLLLDLSMGAFGNECTAGYKHRADLTGLKCIGNTDDAASCNSECCEADKAKCGGLTVTCGWGSYAGNDDAWKNTAATEQNKNTACCKPKATCASGLYSCLAGQRKVNPTSKCSSDANSCLQGGVCCVADVETCGGLKTGGKDKAGNTVNAVTCTGVKKAYGGAAVANKAAVAGTYPTLCCVDQLKCDKAACPAGQKSKDTTTLCTDKDGAASADVKDCTTPCCVANTATCGGNPNVCDAGKTKGKGDAWMGKATTAAATAPAGGAQYTKDCCTAIATCAQATCPSGQTKKANVGATLCTGDVSTCSSTCCEADTTKCGGLTGISCKYGFFDETSTWIEAGTKKTPQSTKDAWNNKAANETNKNTNCCTARVACKVPTGTTTPAPVAVAVTTTPASPAVKFSEHKVAVEEGSARPWGANMVWLGAGGLIGMGVLMVVQGLRSKKQAAYTRLA